MARSLSVTTRRTILAALGLLALAFVTWGLTEQSDRPSDQVELATVWIDTVQEYVEILDGLEVGDRIILSDSRFWDDYDRIYLR